MTLSIVWFVVVAFFWTGFFVLEGFDFGVGALHKIVGRTDLERRVAINTIGPVWDGNEVWLIVAGAAMFAAFPPWYATWFSALYLALDVRPADDLVQCADPEIEAFQHEEAGPEEGDDDEPDNR